MAKDIGTRLPNELLEKADVATEVSHKNRTEIVRDALQQYLREVEDDETFQEAVVKLYLGDEIEFETLKEFIGQQDAEAAQASKDS